MWNNQKILKIFLFRIFKQNTELYGVKAIFLATVGVELAVFHWLLWLLVNVWKNVFTGYFLVKLMNLLCDKQEL